MNQRANMTPSERKIDKRGSRGTTAGVVTALTGAAVGLRHPKAGMAMMGAGVATGLHYGGPKYQEPTISALRRSTHQGIGNKY